MNDNGQMDYWGSFWVEQGNNADSLDAHTQVFRTLNKEPIAQDCWQETVDYVLSQFSLNRDQSVLDLAGGNGMFAREIAAHVERVTVVDFADGLLKQVSETENIETVCADMRNVEFSKHSFDHVLLYAALQYLTFEETTRLLKRIHHWLKPGGICFIGDIPDVSKIWNFFNSTERRSAYFSAIDKGQPIVGTWFDRMWLASLAEHAAFDNIQTLDQPSSQIYSWFRFDLRCEK